MKCGVRLFLIKMLYEKLMKLGNLQIMMDKPHWLLNRVICSDRTQNHGTAPPKGFYQCLDTHTPIGHVRQLRLKRNQTFNPYTCEPFPQFTESLDKDGIKQVGI